MSYNKITYCVPSYRIVKSSALLFDKLIVPWEGFGGEKDDYIPSEIRHDIKGLSGFKGYELLEDGTVSDNLNDDEFRVKLSGKPGREGPELIFQYFKDEADAPWSAHVRAFTEISLSLGINAIPLYNSQKQFNLQYPPGHSVAYQAALHSIDIVRDSELDWNQIIDFRKDRESLRKYRDLKLWLYDGLRADSVEHAIDVISAKLDDYSWAIKKHGFKTVTGNLSEILDSKTLVSAAVGSGVAGIITGPIGAAISGGLLIFSKISINFSERLIELEDVKRGGNSEIAYIYDVNKEFSK